MAQAETTANRVGGSHAWAGMLPQAPLVVDRMQGEEALQAHLSQAGDGADGAWDLQCVPEATKRLHPNDTTSRMNGSTPFLPPKSLSPQLIRRPSLLMAAMAP